MITVPYAVLFRGALELVDAAIAEPEPMGVGALLHEWEAFGAKSRRIERYWQPSPFPFELV